jgi:hydrogenase expression/formation protein HypC
MCIAVPGRVMSISGGRAKVDFSGNIVEADVRLVDAKVGDYVLVHAGCAIEVMKPSQAEDLTALLEEIEALSHEQA